MPIYVFTVALQGGNLEWVNERVFHFLNAACDWSSCRFCFAIICSLACEVSLTLDEVIAK